MFKSFSFRPIADGPSNIPPCIHFPIQDACNPTLELFHELQQQEFAWPGLEIDHSDKSATRLFVLTKQAVHLLNDERREENRGGNGKKTYNDLCNNSGLSKRFEKECKESGEDQHETYLKD